MKKYHKLQNAVIISFSVLALVLIVVISLVVGVQYVQKEMDNTKNTAFAYTKAVAEYIDGDRIKEYVESGEKDDYYYEILDFLNAYQANSSIQYYYVFVPEEDDLIYVWDADMEEGARELGEHEEYMEGGKEAVAKIYKQNPEEEISLADDDTYGYIASAYSPVFDSTGTPVAAVGVDVSMPNLQNNIIHFLIRVIVAVVFVVLVVPSA